MLVALSGHGPDHVRWESVTLNALIVLWHYDRGMDVMAQS